MNSTRRVFLTGSLVGVGLLAVGGVGLGLRKGAQHPVPERLAFDPVAFRTLQAFAARVCPQRHDLPTADALHIAERVDEHVSTLHPTDQRELNQALHLLENALAGMLIEGRMAPFSIASPAVQDRALRRWRQSSITVLRSAFLSLRALCATAYYGHPDVFAAVGYPGAPDYGQSRAPAIQPPQQPASIGVPT